MANEPSTQPTSQSTSQSGSQSSTRSDWQAKQAYAMAAICLVVGLAIGYLFRGSQSPAPAKAAASVPAPANVNVQTVAAPGAHGAMGGGQMPSLEDMKHMADKKAEPLLDKLKADPKNADLLIQVGNLYKSTHQFKDAAAYYDKALQMDPKNVAIRTEMASCLYYNGDADGAIRELQKSLRENPKDANSLFNLGMIKWQGKQDTKGALGAWRELLKQNPQLSADRKATVEKLIADAQMQGKS